MTSDLLANTTYKYGKTYENIAYIIVENRELRGAAADEEFYAIDFICQESETKVTEAIQAIINEKAPDTSNTTLFVPVIIRILAVTGIIQLSIWIRRSKR